MNIKEKTENHPSFPRLGINHLEAKKVLELAGVVPEQPVISSMVCTVLNRHFDAKKDPTTTIDSAKVADLMFSQLAKENPLEKFSFELAQNYFKMTKLFLEEETSPKERYSTIFNFLIKRECLILLILWKRNM